MKQLLLIKYFLFSLTIILIISCEEENNSTTIKLVDGIYITNEGNWGQSNGSLSYYNYSADSVYNDIFYAVNGRPLGDVVQSAAITDELIYVVVNGSNKIEIANKETLEEIAAINNLNNPRFLKIKNSIGYLSQWGDNGVIKVINLNTLNINKTIQVGKGPEQMEIIGNKLFVANSGAYDRDSTISIINIENNEVIDVIKVGDSPRDFAVDKNKKLWVLCYGYQQYTEPYTETASKLIKINPETHVIEKTIEIGTVLHPMYVEAGKNGDYLYIGGGYTFNGIFKISINDEIFPTSPFIDRQFYSIYVDATRDIIFGFDALNYATRGNMYRYDSDGTQLGIYEVGIIPNGSSSKKK